MLTFIKLGGSLITDKREEQAFQVDRMQRVAQEISRALAVKPDLQLLIGHGSGSYGHVAAQKHGTMKGVQTPEQWRGFAEVEIVARRLNNLVVETLFEAGLPIFSIQPSSSARCNEGKLLHMESEPVQ